MSRQYVDERGSYVLLSEGSVPFDHNSTCLLVIANGFWGKTIGCLGAGIE